MSLTYTRAAELVRELKETDNDVKKLLSRIDRLISLNQSTAADWGAGSLPAYLTEDAQGNLDGFTFSRANVSNTMFSLTQIQALLRNQDVVKGDHLGNINVVSDARVP